MAWTNMNDLIPLASDLLVDHFHLNYNNDNANITPAGEIPFGTVVFRAKGLTKSAAWAAVDDAADVVVGNEFGVVYGDQYGFKVNFTPKAIAANKYNAIVIKRGPAMLKEFYLKKVHGTQLGTTFDKLKQLLADQGLVVLDDVSKFDGTI